MNRKNSNKFHCKIRPKENTMNNSDLNHATGEQIVPSGESLFIGIDIEKDDPHQQWLDMPEFVQANREAIKRVVINFESEEDIQEFNKRTGLNITFNTKGVFFPDNSKEDQFEYVDEP